MSNKLEMVYLYTGHSGRYLRSGQSLKDFRSALLEERITHIIYRAQEGLDPALQASWGRMIDWMSTRPQDFPVLYLHPKEQVVVFAVNIPRA